MKLISLRELTVLLADPTHAFSVNGQPAAVHLNALTYQDDSLFALIVWHDAEGREFAVACAEGVNRQVKADDQTLCLIDADDNLLELAYAPRAVPTSA